jgi:glycopeptide antibiotics resistance protein
MLNFVPYPLLFGILILGALLAILRTRKFSSSYLFCFSVFWAYLLSVVKVTIFPIPVPEVWATAMRQAIFILSHANLMPFSYLGFFNPHVILQEISRNVLLTVPFGFGISFIARVRPRDILWLSLGVGLAIEGAQLVVSLVIGGPYRTVDVTDVLLNAIGVWLGYGCFMILCHLYLARTQRLGAELRGLAAHIHEIASRAQWGTARRGQTWSPSCTSDEHKTHR